MYSNIILSQTTLTQMMGIEGIILAVLALSFSVFIYRSSERFIGIAYALTMSGVSILMLSQFTESLTVMSFFQNALVTLWGLRLAAYLIHQDVKQYEVKGNTEKMLPSRPWKRRIWALISMPVFLFLMLSPMVFSLYGGAPSGNMEWVQYMGLAAMAAGFLLEAISDERILIKAKGRLKTTERTGFFNRSHQNSYWGQAIFWIGNWAMGLGYYQSAWGWAISTAGLVSFLLFVRYLAKQEKPLTASYTEDIAGSHSLVLK